MTTIGSRLRQVREASVPSAAQQDAARRAASDLRDMGVETFWNLPPLRINQLLHRLLGPRRGIVVRDGNPVGIGRALFRPKRFR